MSSSSRGQRGRVGGGGGVKRGQRQQQSRGSRGVKGRVGGSGGGGGRAAAGGGKRARVSAVMGSGGEGVRRRRKKKVKTRTYLSDDDIAPPSTSPSITPSPSPSPSPSSPTAVPGASVWMRYGRGSEGMNSSDGHTSTSVWMDEDEERDMQHRTRTSALQQQLSEWLPLPTTAPPILPPISGITAVAGNAPIISAPAPPKRSIHSYIEEELDEEVMQGYHMWADECEQKRLRRRRNKGQQVMTHRAAKYTPLIKQEQEEADVLLQHTFAPSAEPCSPSSSPCPFSGDECEEVEPESPYPSASPTPSSPHTRRDTQTDLPGTFTQDMEDRLQQYERESEGEDGVDSCASPIEDTVSSTAPSDASPTSDAMEDVTEATTDTPSPHAEADEREDVEEEGEDIKLPPRGLSIRSLLFPRSAVGLQLEIESDMTMSPQRSSMSVPHASPTLSQPRTARVSASPSTSAPASAQAPSSAPVPTQTASSAPAQAQPTSAMSTMPATIAAHSFQVTAPSKTLRPISTAAMLFYPQRTLHSCTMQQRSAQLIARPSHHQAGSADAHTLFRIEQTVRGETVLTLDEEEEDES